MLDLFRVKRKHYKRDLLDIESILQSSLKPVSPRPEFIQGLHKGLMEYTFPSAGEADIDVKKAIVFALLGFTGLALVFSLWVRLIVVIISTLGMIHSTKRKKITS